jgi:hypothetical protein
VKRTCCLAGVIRPCSLSRPNELTEGIDIRQLGGLQCSGGDSGAAIDRAGSTCGISGRAGELACTDYIQFDLTEQAYRWIRGELGNITLKEISRLMYEHVAAGGEIDEVPERRPEWTDRYEFHHDLRLTIQETPVYIETRLNWRLPLIPDESWILVVNVHAQ